jgi:DNA-binding response OmpR family regulator
MNSPLALILTSESSRFARWARALAFDGWEVRIEDCPVKAAAACRASELALILVDVKRAAAAADGTSLKGSGRHTAVVACTAGADARGVIQALSDWADDHFPEEIQPELLRAKARAHLRRLLPHASFNANAVRSPDGRLKLDSDTRSVFVASGSKDWTLLCRLTPSEASIMRLLLTSQGQAVARRDVAERMSGGGGRAGNVSTVDKHVESLRRKLARFGPRVITLYGVGYVWQDAPRKS